MSTELAFILQIMCWILVSVMGLLLLDARFNKRQRLLNECLFGAALLGAAVLGFYV